MVEEIKQSELSAVVADKSKEKAEAESPDEANAGAPDALKKQTNASADSGDQTGVQDSSPAPDVGNDVSDTIDVDVFNDDDADSAGQDRGDLDDLEDTPSVGKGGSSDEVDDGEDDEEDDDEEDDDEEGGVGPVLGEEERASIPGPRLRRQVSVAGEFDFNAIGNRASYKFKQCVRLIEADQWDTQAWQVLVNEAQQGNGGGMGPKEVLRKFLKQFPASGRYRRMLAQAEMESGDLQTADKIIQEGLEICASLELWMLYLERARRSGAAAGAKTEHNARADITAAFELALQHVGYLKTREALLFKGRFKGYRGGDNSVPSLV